MVVLNELDLFHLVLAAMKWVGRLDEDVKKVLEDKLLEHKSYVYERGEDMPEIRDWKWES